jgi:hypothetical protein
VTGGIWPGCPGGHLIESRTKKKCGGPPPSLEGGPSRLSPTRTSRPAKVEGRPDCAGMAPVAHAPTPVRSHAYDRRGFPDRPPAYAACQSDHTATSAALKASTPGDVPQLEDLGRFRPVCVTTVFQARCMIWCLHALVSGRAWLLERSPGWRDVVTLRASSDSGEDNPRSGSAPQWSRFRSSTRLIPIDKWFRQNSLTLRTDRVRRSSGTAATVSIRSRLAGRATNLWARLIASIRIRRAGDTKGDGDNFP